jgi:hypothetical protein
MCIGEAGILKGQYNYYEAAIHCFHCESLLLSANYIAKLQPEVFDIPQFKDHCKCKKGSPLQCIKLALFEGCCLQDYISTLEASLGPSRKRTRETSVHEQEVRPTFKKPKRKSKKPKRRSNVFKLYNNL